MKRDEWPPVPLPAPPHPARGAHYRCSWGLHQWHRPQLGEGPRALVSEGPGKIHKVLCISR